MDPNTALNDLRRAVAAIDNNDGMSEHAFSDQLDNIIQEFTALDQWLTGGGFLPNDWNKNT